MLTSEFLRTIWIFEPPKGTLEISHVESAMKLYLEHETKWISVEEKLPEISTFEKYNVVNVKFKTFKTDEEMVCSATLEEISQHCFENSPKHKRWFIFPSAGHELKTVTHWRPIFYGCP